MDAIARLTLKTMNKPWPKLSETLTVPREPMRGFWDGTDRIGRRTGGMFEIWPHEATACNGRDADRPPVEPPKRGQMDLFG